MGTMTYVSDDGTPITFNLVASRSVARRSNMPLTYEEIVAMTQGQTGIPIVPETVIPVVVISADSNHCAVHHLPRASPQEAP